MFYVLLPISFYAQEYRGNHGLTSWLSPLVSAALVLP
jgi:hypothetical protein